MTYTIYGIAITSSKVSSLSLREQAKKIREDFDKSLKEYNDSVNRLVNDLEKLKN
jgi:hypothetical protein